VVPPIFRIQAHQHEICKAANGGEIVVEFVRDATR
jgi:hypothetical protein